MNPIIRRAAREDASFLAWTILAAALSAFRAGDAYPLSQQAMTEAARELGLSDAEQQDMWRLYFYRHTRDLR